MQRYNQYHQNTNAIQINGSINKIKEGEKNKQKTIKKQEQLAKKSLHSYCYSPRATLMRHLFNLSEMTFKSGGKKLIMMTNSEEGVIIIWQHS